MQTYSFWVKSTQTLIVHRVIKKNKKNSHSWKKGNLQLLKTDKLFP